jgi:serine/threonine-protein kinase
MLIRGSSPLIGVPVSIDGRAGEWITDDEGMVEVDVPSGTWVLHLQLEDGPVSVEAQIDASDTLVVVGVDEPDSHTETAAMGLSDGVTVGERYRIDRILGRGGMGVVFKAYDELLHRPVAIKALSDALQANEEAQRLFLDEARSLAQLSHPNLVGIHDVISQDGQSMMVTEFVDGVDLEGVIERDAPLSSERIARLGMQLCAAIGVLHENGFIHRDIKPANAIMERGGMLKLIDFGLARSMERLMKRGTQVRGTPAYMAPEQTLGEDLSPSTDVYQLGVTLYEMALGEVPFGGASAAFDHIREEIPPVTEVRPELDARLAQIVASCLRKDAAERPQHACEVRDKLASLVEALDAEVAAAETHIDADHRDASVSGQMERNDGGAHLNTEGQQDWANVYRWVAAVVVVALVASMGALWLDGESEESVPPGERSPTIRRAPTLVQDDERAEPSAVVREDAREAIRAARETFDSSVLAATLSSRYAEADRVKARRQQTATSPAGEETPEPESANDRGDRATAESPGEAETASSESVKSTENEREGIATGGEERRAPNTKTPDAERDAGASTPPSDDVAPRPPSREPARTQPDRSQDTNDNKRKEEVEDEKDKPAREAPRVF